MKNQSLKQQIINLVAEIQAWNQGDMDTTIENETAGRGGSCELDKECVEARAHMIGQLEKLVLQIKD